MKFDQTLLVVYFGLEFVSCIILQTYILKLINANHKSREENLHSPSYEEEGTELRFISRCTEMHISFFSGGSMNQRLDDRKLPTCFSRDSEYPNHWFGHLLLCFLFYSHWKNHHMHLALVMVLIICIDRYQLPDVKMLAKWPGCDKNIHWIEKGAWRHGNPAQGKTCDGHGKLPISFKSTLSYSDVIFSLMSLSFHDQHC